MLNQNATETTCKLNWRRWMTTVRRRRRQRQPFVVLVEQGKEVAVEAGRASSSS